MKLATDSLDIFVRSLPKGCKFSVISFGSGWDALQPITADYNDTTSQNALEQIKNFDSNYGGTNILEPLIAAQTSE